MALETMKYYTVDELTTETLMGMVDELKPRASAIVGMVPRYENDGKKITIRVHSYQATSTSPLVGFADRTPLSKGFEADEFDVYPFHTKEGWEADVLSNFLEASGDGFRISAEGVVAGMTYLEQKRLELFSSMWHTALNEKIFTWRDQPDPDKPTNKIVSMDLSDYIWDLTAPSTELNDPTAKAFLAVDAMAEEYFAETGFMPDTVFVSGTTLNTLKANDYIFKTIHAQATDQPDRGVETRDRVEINGITFVALRGKYTTPTGGQAGPVDEGLGIVTNMAIRFKDGRGILRHESLRNLLNRNNAARAYYKSRLVSEDPPSISLDMYDNGVPVVAHSRGVAHWQMYTP